jgi:hypothetical protein
MDTGSYPDASLGLAALYSNPDVALWDGPYIEPAEIPEDSWGTAVRYTVNGMKVLITSPGSDKAFGTHDDISYGDTEQDLPGDASYLSAPES